jgi:RNA polymerase sigma-70 factor (ECF subfamily)
LEDVTPANRMDDGEQGRGGLRVVPGGMTPGRREEDALVAAFLVGDDAAFGELFRRHQALVLAIVRRYTRSPDESADLVQRTFLRAFEAARRSLGRGPRAAIPFRRWLVRVAVNLGKNHARNAARLARLRLEEVAPTSVEPAGADGLERRRREERVRSAVQRLPPRQREVLTLRIDAELPFAEIASTLGITENAAKVSFHYATRALRAALAEEEP